MVETSQLSLLEGFITDDEVEAEDVEMADADMNDFQDSESSGKPVESTSGEDNVFFQPEEPVMNEQEVVEEALGVMKRPRTESAHPASIPHYW